MIIVIVPWPTLFSKLLSLPLQCWSHCSFWKAACDDGQDQCLEVGLTNITSRWNVMTRPDKPAQAEASLSQCFCTISRNLSGTSLWRCEVCSGACARSHMCSASRAKLHTRRDESRRGRPNKSKAGGAAGWIWNSVWFMAATPNRSKHADVYKHTQTEERRTGKKKEWWKKNRTWQRVKQVYEGETCLELLQEISGGTNCNTDAAHIASYNALRKLSITAGPFKVSSLLLFVGLLLLVLLWDQRSSRKKGNI